MYRVAELFSGIGSTAMALRRIGIDVELAATCEWDIHAIVAYDLIHNGPELPADVMSMTREEMQEQLRGRTFSRTGKGPLPKAAAELWSDDFLRSVCASVRRNRNFVDITDLKGTDLPGGVDLLTYTFPCQDLSNVGAFHGYRKGIGRDSGSRSSLLWQVGRILDEMRQGAIPLPRFLMMENVPALLAPRHLRDFTRWICELRELGYVSCYFQLNAADFGLPQNRPRLIMISVQVGDDPATTGLVLDYFRSLSAASLVRDFQASPHFAPYTVQDLLRTDYRDPQLFLEARECTPNDTDSRHRIWEENPQLVCEGYRPNTAITQVRTITTKQDRNPNSGNLYFESGLPGRSSYRFLTPRECMLLMGFSDRDYRVLRDNSPDISREDPLFPRDAIYRLAGNSIPVPLLEGVFLQISRIDDLLRNAARGTAPTAASH